MSKQQTVLERKAVYAGVGTMHTGWCMDESHERCNWLSYSPSREGYVACKCECHGEDSAAIAARISELEQRHGSVQKVVAQQTERKPKTFPTEWDEQTHAGTIVQVGTAAVRKYAPALPDGSKDVGVRYRYRCATCDGTGKWHRTLEEALAKAGVHDDKHREVQA